MYCNKCGDIIEPNETYCNKCGNYLGNYNKQKNPSQPLYTNQDKKKNGIFIGVGVGLGAVFLIFVVSLLLNNSGGKYFFDLNPHEDSDNVAQSTGSSSVSKRGKYSTAIIYDNTYSGVKINSDKDAYKLITNDSVSQKKNCPAEIKAVENEIISKYGITAVNLCEMDVNFARELGNVIKKIYDEYPGARGYITNLSLANVSMSDGYIAAFMPVFNFATSNTSSTYPWVIKTQVLLNTSYFLNSERLQASVTDGSNAGHFPPNSTIYSPIAHELGHYLSFLAMMNNYNLSSILLVDNNNVNIFYKLYSDFGEGNFSLQMINEAFNKYKRDTNTTMSIDEWRGTISKYALAKDNSGNYIYDETIAESFHDVYLNGNNAKDASKYIIQVLKSKLKDR
jgi:hypothetical protein